MRLTPVVALYGIIVEPSFKRNGNLRSWLSSTVKVLLAKFYNHWLKHNDNNFNSTRLSEFSLTQLLLAIDLRTVTKPFSITREAYVKFAKKKDEKCWDLRVVIIDLQTTSNARSFEKQNFPYDRSILFVYPTSIRMLLLVLKMLDAWNGQRCRMSLFYFSPSYSWTALTCHKKWTINEQKTGVDEEGGETRIGRGTMREEALKEEQEEEEEEVVSLGRKDASICSKPFFSVSSSIQGRISRINKRKPFKLTPSRRR